jgi:hypothetical protein
MCQAIFGPIEASEDGSLRRRGEHVREPFQRRPDGQEILREADKLPVRASARSVEAKRVRADERGAIDSWLYEARQPAKDAPVITVMRGLSAQFPRFGYRRIRGAGLHRVGRVH